MARERAVGAPFGPRDGGTVTETGGDDAPARAGYVDDAIRRMRVASAAAGRGGAPGAAGSADPEVLRAALAGLAPDDQRLLWATHVQRQEVSTVASALGTHPRTVARLLPPAEQALATALADAHARGCPPGCADTRAAVLDLVHRRLPAGQEAELEDHLLDCAGCLRAYVDVRDPAWAARDAGPRLLAGGWCPSAVAATVAQGAADAAARAPRPARRQSWLIVAGTVACVAVAAVAIALGTGDAAPAAPDPGTSPGATTVGTVPGGATSPVATPSATPRGDGTPGTGPTPSEGASATPSGEPSPTASTDDDAEADGPSTSPTSSPARDDEPTTSPTSSASTSTGSATSKPTSRPPSSTTTPPDEGSPTATPSTEPTDETTTTPPADPDPGETDPGETDPDPDPTESDPTDPGEAPTDPAQ
ncbi:hypothetical protein JCM11754A_14510 [Isoptericola variabilis]